MTLNRPDGTRLAINHRTGAGPTILFLPGYASDMEGSKALALDQWAVETGRPMLRFDYGGCGASDGDFQHQTLTDWIGDAQMLADHIEGDIIIVGSSMGGWIALKLAQTLGDRVAGLIGIAAAPDFTGWGFSAAEKDTLAREGQLFRPSDYGAPLLTTHAFWESGEANRVLTGPIDIHCPVRLLHGQDDPDVPWRISLEIAERLRSGDVHVTLIKDGDHRLSRPQDLSLLIATVSAMVENT